MNSETNNYAPYLPPPPPSFHSAHVFRVHRLLYIALLYVCRVHTSRRADILVRPRILAAVHQDDNCLRDVSEMCVV